MEDDTILLELGEIKGICSTLTNSISSYQKRFDKLVELENVKHEKINEKINKVDKKTNKEITVIKQEQAKLAVWNKIVSVGFIGAIIFVVKKMFSKLF